MPLSPASSTIAFEHWAKNEDFELASTVLELRGRCAQCREDNS